jgi:hypothetical protein
MGTARLTQLVLDADRLLRHKSLDGTRVQVTSEQVAQELNITLESAKQALTTLSRIDRSGLKAIRGLGFEYIVPENYPKRLSDMQHTLNQEEAKKPKFRGQLTAEVLAWCRRHPDLMPCHISHVAEALEADPKSVGQSLLRLARAGQLQMSSLGQGWYDKLPTGSSDLLVRIAEDDPADAIYDNDEPPSGGAEAILIDRAVQQAMHNGTGVGVTPPVEVYATIKPPWPALLRVVAETAEGYIVADAQGQAYKMAPL